MLAVLSVKGEVFLMEEYKPERLVWEEVQALAGPGIEGLPIGQLMSGDNLNTQGGLTSGAEAKSQSLLQRCMSQLIASSDNAPESKTVSIKAASPHRIGSAQQEDGMDGEEVSTTDQSGLQLVLAVAPEGIESPVSVLPSSLGWADRRRALLLGRA